MKISIVKTENNVFKVAYNSDYEAIKKLKLNKVYSCEIKAPRNYQFHKKYFALINLVYQNQERYTDFEKLRKDLIKASGFVDEWINFKGETETEAKSISFSKMSSEDFAELYERTKDSIHKYFHFDKEDIEQNIEQYF